jgi:hypothetical protein
MNKIKVEKKEHLIYREWKKAGELSYPLELSFPCPIGKWQYFYSSKKGVVSLIKLQNHLYKSETLNKMDIWEIYSVKGNLFDGVECFYSKKQAEERIKELLE